MATDQDAERATDVPDTEFPLFGCHGNQVGVGRDRNERDGVCGVRGHLYSWITAFSHCVCV